VHTHNFLDSRFLASIFKGDVNRELLVGNQAVQREDRVLTFGDQVGAFVGLKGVLRVCKRIASGLRISVRHGELTDVQHNVSLGLPERFSHYFRLRIVDTGLNESNKEHSDSDAYRSYLSPIRPRMFGFSYALPMSATPKEMHKPNEERWFWASTGIMLIAVGVLIFRFSFNAMRDVWLLGIVLFILSVGIISLGIGCVGFGLSGEDFARGFGDCTSRLTNCVGTNA
jgi:hypothetical protein